MDFTDYAAVTVDLVPGINSDGTETYSMNIGMGEMLLFISFQGMCEVAGLVTFDMEKCEESMMCEYFDEYSFMIDHGCTNHINMF